MSKLQDIKTEKIHFCDCVKCDESEDTGEHSHYMTKKEAVKVFEGLGWRYVKGTGWLCPKCKGR